MAKQYFIKVTTNAPGNRLCEIVSNYVHIKYNHMIIDAADFDKLKQDVASKIDAAMEECPRCRKPVLSEYKVDDIIRKTEENINGRNMFNQT